MTDGPAKSAADYEGVVQSLRGLRSQAQEKLSQDIFDYLDGGAEREMTLRANRSDFGSITLLPLVMRDVSEPDLSTQILGKHVSLPLGFSPTALHRLVHPDGEVASARAAHTSRLPLTVSAMSSVAIEEIAERSGHDNLWFQTYLFKDPGLAPGLIARAEASGYQAIVISAGCPVMGYRDRNLENRFELPPSVEPAHFTSGRNVDHNNPISSFQGADVDPSATWKDIERLRCQTKLPVLIKGLMNPADVAPALDAGAEGLIVSNHGGRQLDSTSSTIHALPRIAEELSGRGTLLVDSGFRRGTDVIKALALGADAILLGRPLLWALAVGGSAGVTIMISQLAAEIKIAMQLVGCENVSSLRENAELILGRKAI